jgi:uncharacterized protein
LWIKNRKSLVLAALAAAGEGVEFAPVHVQKLFFLIDREAASLVNGPHFDFRPYDFGPFDQAVYQELDLLSMLGTVQIQKTEKFRTYRLTQSGYAEGQDILLSLPPDAQRMLTDIAQWVCRLSFHQLVSAIYKYYPDMKEKSIFVQ